MREIEKVVQEFLCGMPLCPGNPHHIIGRESLYTLLLSERDAARREENVATILEEARLLIGRGRDQGLMRGMDAATFALGYASGMEARAAALRTLLPPAGTSKEVGSGE